LASGDRVRVHYANKWHTGNLVAFGVDSLVVAKGDDRREIPLLALQSLEVSEGKRVSGGKTFVSTLSGFMIGTMTGLIVANAKGPSEDCGEICFEGMSYMVLGAGAGIVAGFAWGVTPEERWHQLYPEDTDDKR
jgi:hypothetical protein